MTIIQNLLGILGGAPTLAAAAANFRDMTGLARDMVIAANEAFWCDTPDETRIAWLREQDLRMNELEASIHRDAVNHLSGSEPADVPYCLLLISLVKDVERIGDYANNLVNIPEMLGQELGPLPDDEICTRLRAVGHGIEQLAREAPDIYEAADVEPARQAVEAGRARASECDKLVQEIAAASYDAALATRLTLAIRFYKRIQGHLLKLLVSLLSPLDRLDQYDESGPEYN